MTQVMFRVAPVLLLWALTAAPAPALALAPRDSESREVFSLDGLWDFVAEPINEIGMIEQWFFSRLSQKAGAQLMPVPSSYNDVTQEAWIRDLTGMVWYQRCLVLPERFLDQSRRVLLRFDSVNYEAYVYVNGEYVKHHQGGHLPFEVSVGALLAGAGREACITVGVSNILTPSTIPQGRVFRANETDNRYPPGYISQSLEFDFFNYAGIHRSVVLHTAPHSHVHDVTLSTRLEQRGDGDSASTVGIIEYLVEFRGPAVRLGDFYFNLVLTDEDGVEAARVSFSRELRGQLVVAAPRLWWPFLSRDQSRFAHLYTLEVQFVPNNNIQAQDIYRLNVGIRSLDWNHSNIFINGQPFYFRGFGRHEDSDVHGRGLDVALAWHDGFLLQWLGANSYRTSHYPYSEESLDVADRLGLVVIAETPAVGLKSFSDRMLRRHEAVSHALVSRDKNRPSVVMWSLANEPLSQLPAADSYFRSLANNVTSLDPTRPTTIVTSQRWNNDVAVQHVDVVCVNRYSGWYGDPGRLELVALQTRSEMRRWHERFSKPVIVSEYGAGALAGLHAEPNSIWTEDYQAAIFYKHFEAFDNLENDGFFIGEMVWNFADFATPQEVIRPTGCMKGVLTRNRRPKLGARVIRRRYWQLARGRCQQLLGVNNNSLPANACAISEKLEFDF